MSARTTRSNKVFSPWDMCYIEKANPDFDLEKLLQDRMKMEADQPDGTDEGDEQLELETTTSQSANFIPSPSSLPRPTTVPLVETPMNNDDDTPPANTRKRRRNASSHKARAAKRAQPEFGTAKPRKSIVERYSDGGTTFECPLDLDEADVTSTGYVGLRDLATETKVQGLDYFVGKDSHLKFTLQHWDGSAPMALVDGKRRLVGILAGKPDADNWPTLIQEATKALENARIKRESISAGSGRRGAFDSIRCGVSHGGGQKEPGNLCNNSATKEILHGLNDTEAFVRVSSFSSSVMATRMPKLYGYYAENMGKLYDHYEGRLTRPFPRSIQSSTTYNLGPDTVCLPHTDYGNLAVGMCSITPLGDFDYHKGGHLVLWECRLVIEFPPGSTILIPSAIITHSNTAIGTDERRYSFTQYTAGALFRWVDNKFQKATAYRESLTAEQLEKVKADDAIRWEKSLSLLPVLQEKICSAAEV